MRLPHPVADSQQVVDDLDLVRHLRAAQNRHKGLLGIGNAFGQVLNLLGNQIADNFWLAAWAVVDEE